MHRLVPFALALTCAQLASQSPSFAARIDPDGAPPQPVTETWTAPRPVARQGGAFGPAAIGNRFLSTDQAPEGDMPRDLAFTPDGTTVLIANRDTDMVTFLDVATRTIVASVQVGDFPVDVDVSPDGLWAAVPNVFDDTVSILSVPARAVIATVPVTGTQPFQVHMTADSQFAVVGVINDAVTSALSVISLFTFTEVRTIPTGSQGVMGGFFTPERGISGNLYTQFAVSPDSVTVVVPDRAASQVALYDLVAGIPLAVLPTPTLPTAVDIDAAGTLAIVSHEGAAQAITKIDLVTLALSGTPLAIGQQLQNQVLRLVPTASHAMAAVTNNLIFVDLATGAVTSTVATGTVGDIEVSFDGQFAFVSNAIARVISIATQTQVAAVTAEPGVEAAMSPVAQIAVQLDNRFYENAVVFSTNGAASALLGAVQSGPPAEGDATRSLAISTDGRTIVACNIVSGNVAVVDAAAETVRAYVPTGTRVWEAAITPNGQTAVVCNTDSDTVSIVDLATDAVVATLSVPSRPMSVRVSPDSTRAYVSTIAGTDRLATIALNGAASSVIGSVPTGQMGTITYSTGVASGIALSPDGSLLALCVSFDDRMKLFSTVSGAIVADLPAGDFPVQAAFSPDGSRLFVANSFTDDVTVYAVAGAATTVLGTVPGTEFPLRLSVDEAGAYVYVGCFDFTTPRVAVLDAATRTVVANVPLPATPYSQAYSEVDHVLYVSTTGGQLVRIRADGPASAVIDTEALTGAAADMVFSESLRRAFGSQMGLQDGIDVVAYGGVFDHYGPALPGTGGIAPRIEGTGVPAQGLAVTIDVTQGLPNTGGLLFLGVTPTAIPVLGGTLLVIPDLTFFHLLSPSGSYALGLSVPNAPIFVGLDVFLQSAYADAGAVAGVSHTDGLVMQIR